MKPNHQCSNCGTQIHWGDKYCGRCGQAVEWPETEQSRVRNSTEAGILCKRCGSRNDAGNQFCDVCGVALGGGEIKQAVEKKREMQLSKKAGKAPPVVGSWKIVLGFFVFLGAGIFLLETVTTTQKAPIPANQSVPQSSQQAANMQVLPQIEEMEKQLASNPRDINLTLQLANFLNDNRFFDKSIHYYKTYLQSNPKDANARVDMAICYKELGNTEEAKREMKRALEYDPKHLFAHFNLGIVNLVEGNVAEASDWFRKTVALAPNSEVGKRAQQLLAQHNQRDLQTN